MLEDEYDPAEELQKDYFGIGKRIKVNHLMSMPEYNETFGPIVGWSFEHMRWQVRMDLDH